MNFAREELDVNSRFALREGKAVTAVAADPLVRRKARGGRIDVD